VSLVAEEAVVSQSAVQPAPAEEPPAESPARPTEDVAPAWVEAHGAATGPALLAVAAVTGPAGVEPAPDRPARRGLALAPVAQPPAGHGPRRGPARTERAGRGAGASVRGVEPWQPDRELLAARRRARQRLPSPAAVARDVAMALLEVEAGCRSAVQLERICAPQVWAELEPQLHRRGGPLPSGRCLLTVFCQEDTPGLADVVAVVRRHDRVAPVARCGWTRAAAAGPSPS
jgi:hypothetical protein